MLTDLVSIPDPEITAVTFKILVQWIGAEYGAGRNLIALAERGPALDVNVGLQTRLRPNHHILIDDGILADHYARAEDGIAMHSCRGSDLSGGGDPRGRRHRSGDRPQDHEQRDPQHAKEVPIVSDHVHQLTPLVFSQYHDEQRDQ